jgi:predicted GNAT family acetyltransferase
MIRILKEADRQTAMAFLSEEAAINLFIIGDIEVYGFDTDFQCLWGQFDAAGELEGILLKYRNSYIPYYSKETFETGGFARIIEAAAKENEIVLSGKGALLEPFMKLLPDYHVKNMFFCELSSMDDFKPQVINQTIRIAKADEAMAIKTLIDQIEEFRGTVTSADEIAMKIENKAGRVYYIEKASKVTTVAQTSAENSKSAMIVGVATHPDFRNKGYTSQCMTKLCKDVLLEGKGLCLFYDNPSAGSIYHRLGFKTIGQWMMIKPNVT